MLGLDLGSKLIKVSQLKKNRNNFILHRYAYIDTPQESVAGGKILSTESVASRLKVLLREKNFKGKKVVTTISGENVIIRNLIFPKMSRKELMEAMKYEA